MHSGLAKAFLHLFSPVNLISMNKTAVRNVAPVIGASIIVALVTYAINSWLFSTQPYLISRNYLSSIDTLFIEGMIYIIIGALLFLGSGGISRTSQRAAILASTAKAFDDDVIGPAEIFRRDAWKPKGFTRAALVLIMAGTILIITYLASL